MPFNGSGAFAPPGSSFPAVAGTLIEAAKFNNTINDIATGLSTCITKDGQTTVTANIPMGGYKLTGLGASMTNGDAVRYQQVFDGSGGTTVPYLPAGTGAVSRTVQGKLRETASIIDYGGLVDGSTNDSTAIQNAVNANTEVLIPAGVCMMSSQVAIDSPCHLVIEAIIKPKVTTGTPGTPLFLIRSSDVTIEFRGEGGIDGISSTYSNWNGIAALSSTDTLENVNVIGGNYTNIGLQNTACQVIAFSYVKNGEIHKPKISNCGVTTSYDWASAIGMIYTAYCENVNVVEPEGDTVGTTWINSSANLNCNFVRPSAKYVSLFGYKSGFGNNYAVTNDEAPSSTTFCVAATADTRRQIRAGQAFTMPSINTSGPRGVVKSVVDNTTYLKITTTDDMVETPSVGDNYQGLDTNTKWIDPRLWYCGDNGFDLHGFYNTQILFPVVDYAGMYKIGASYYSGLRAGIWTGYDQQGSNNSMFNNGLIIDSPVVRHSGGNGISCQVTSAVSILYPSITYFNDGALSTAGYGDGIGVNTFVLGAQRQAGIRIVGPSISGGNAAGGRALSVNFCSGVNIESPSVAAVNGVKINECTESTYDNDDIYVTGTGAIALLLSNDSGNFPCDNIRIGSGKTNVTSSSGYNLNISDTNAIRIFIDPMRINLGSASVPMVNSSDDSLTVTPYGGEYAGQNVMPLKRLVTNGASVTIGQFAATTNTGGGLIIQGVVERYASGMAAFQVVFYGHAASTGKSYTEYGHTGSTPVVTGDFTMSVSGNVITCTYTNNSGGTVGMNATVTALGSF